MGEKIVALLLCMCAAACGRPSTQSTTERRSAPAESSSLAAGGAGPDAGPSAADAPDRNGAAAWRGSYHSESATIFVPPEWKGVHWTVPPTSEGLGDGTMAIEINGPRVSGTLDGPLGPASLDGVVSGPNITATVRRRDPADHGYAGTLIAARAGDTVDGTMKLSLGEASAVRTATFSLSRKP